MGNKVDSLERQLRRITREKEALRLRCEMLEKQHCCQDEVEAEVEAEADTNDKGNDERTDWSSMNINVLNLMMQVSNQGSEVLDTDADVDEENARLKLLFQALEELGERLKGVEEDDADDAADTTDESSSIIESSTDVTWGLTSIDFDSNEETGVGVGHSSSLSLDSLSPMRTDGDDHCSSIDEPTLLFSGKEIYRAQASLIRVKRTFMDCIRLHFGEELAMCEDADADVDGGDQVLIEGQLLVEACEIFMSERDSYLDEVMALYDQARRDDSKV